MRHLLIVSAALVVVSVCIAQPAVAAAELCTNDGTKLVMDAATGALEALELDGENVLREAGALYIADFAAGSPAEAVRGPLTRRSGGSFVQSITMDALGIAAKTTYQVKGNAIRVHCHVRDLRGEDRAIVLSCRLPVDAAGWRWGQDLAGSQAISSDPNELAYPEVYRNPVTIGAGAEGIISRYPFSAISSRKHGLSYAIRMDEPRVFVMQYRNDLRCYEISFSLGLSQATAKFPGEAEVSFLIYAHDARWGFRSAAQRYYDMFPEFFEVRLERMGGWYCNTRDKALGGVAEAYDFNFAYHECWAGKAENMEPSNRLGVYTYHYTEPWFYWQLLPDEFMLDGKPTLAGGIRKLEHDVNPDNKGLLTRDGASAGIAAEVCDITYDDFVRIQARSVSNSLLWDADGNPVGSVRTYPWGPRGDAKGQYRARIPLDLDPDIPEGAGQFQKQWMFDPAYVKAEQLGCTLDGMYLDSHGAVSAYCNFRKDHFRYADIPLTFDTLTARPCILNDFSAFEFCDWLAREMRKQNRSLLVNYYHKRLFFNLIHWDAIGSEGYKRGEMFARTLCYRKPYSDLAYGVPPKPVTPLYWREYLLYATFPGQATNRRETYRQIGSLVKAEMAAGWEPVTLARCSDDDIRIERYGRVADANLLFAIQNAGDRSEEVTLRLDRQLELGGTEVAYDLVNERFCPLDFEKGRSSVELKLLGGETTLLAVGTPRQVAGALLGQAQAYWADVMRVETYGNCQAVADSLRQLSTMLAGGSEIASIQQTVEKSRELWDLDVSPQAHTAGLVERAASVLQGLRIRVEAVEEANTRLITGVTGMEQGDIAGVNWELTTPDGWEAEAAVGTPLGTAAWQLTRPEPDAKQAGEAVFYVRARLEKPDGRVHLLDKRLVRMVVLEMGEAKDRLVSDDLEGADALKGWCWRAGGTDLTTGRGETGFSAEAANSGKQGFRIDNSQPAGTVGVRSPFFREEFAPGDYLRASVAIRQTAGQGVSLYVQGWKNPKGPNYYTVVRTKSATRKAQWEQVSIETEIPEATTAISFEVYASKNKGIFDFDDVELLLFESRQVPRWLGAD